MSTRYILIAATAALLSGCLLEPSIPGPLESSKEQHPEAEPRPTIAVKKGAHSNTLPTYQAEISVADQVSRRKMRAHAPAAVLKMAGIPHPLPPSYPQENRDRYAELEENGVKLTQEHPVSTLSIDVDTGSYANIRRYLNNGNLPPKNAVRVEELINYFSYNYPVPNTRKEPIQIYTEAATTPWNKNTLLLHVGVQGYQPTKRPAANLVFLVDISGSMHAPNKLPLLKSSFKLLVNNLTKKDRVSLVTYAGNAGIVLEPTPGDQKHKILTALDRLTAGGSTHGSAGIKEAYALAEQAKLKEGINRIILATDGDFNVGTVSHNKLVELIETKRKQGISLTTLGFGQGNYNDHLMEQLADKGNGNYGYIDTISEAQKLLVDELASTLETIAGDVKVQIEFNPESVSEYRLIGYENRLLNREDFNNDKVDAGEIGAGHTVTALYEITLKENAQKRIDPLRYGKSQSQTSHHSDELAFFKLRYKLPGEKSSTLIQQPIKRDVITDNPSQRFRFSSAVAAFGQLLRDGKQLGDYSHKAITNLAHSAKGDDFYGYRSEFIRLIRLAESLKNS